MRGADITQESLFTTATLANFVPQNHPLREIRALVDEALGRMNSLFSTLYPETGRASIAPEKLLRAQLLQLFYSIRSERLLMEQLQYNLLFRWFVGIAIDEADPVRTYAKQVGINYPILIGELDATELGRALGNETGGLPFTVVFDRGGRVVKTVLGGTNEAHLAPILQPLL